MMIWNSLIMSNQIPWGAAQSSQESLLEMIRPLIHIEAGNTLPNLPGKWQLNWECECLQGLIPQIPKSMTACDQTSSNNHSISTESIFNSTQFSTFMTNFRDDEHLHSFIAARKPNSNVSTFTCLIQSNQPFLNTGHSPLPSLEVLCRLGQVSLHPLIKHLLASLGCWN
jgi:hypothetical protein